MSLLQAAFAGCLETGMHEAALKAGSFKSQVINLGLFLPW